MTTYTFRVGIVGLLFSSLSVSAHAGEVAQEQLRKFKADHKAFMESQSSIQKYLQKYKIDEKTGQEVYQGEEPTAYDSKDSVQKFSPDEIKRKTFADKKNMYHEGFGAPAAQVQNQIDEYVEGGRADIVESEDSAATLVGDVKLKTLEQMDKKYKSAQLKESPWSSDYWAIYSGVLAKRYNDDAFATAANGQDWTTISNYILNQPMPNASSMDLLSPAEKYDVLVGDTAGDRKDLNAPGWSLTKAMLREGKQYADDNNGKVETWMGICHGWAPAAFMEHRPTNVAEMMAPNGIKIKFYPSDIKALASLLWAKAEQGTKTNFVGTRCNIKADAMKIDAESNRIEDQTCFDTNPGTWHMAVVNMLGLKKRSFVLDATWDYEVWNQPAYAYEYTYFNPISGKEVASLADAKVKYADFKATDKFAKYRGKSVASVVGIAMKFTYIAETAPRAVPRDDQGHDRRVAVNYLYDLELDKDGKITGGEWYHQQHPDFMWSPSDDSAAISKGDVLLDDAKDRNHWHKRHLNAAPKAWTDAAISSSSPAGQPLARIVKELLQKSNQSHLGRWNFNFNNDGRY